MIRTAVDAVDAPSASGNYAQAVKVEGARELLFVSGQIPVDPAGQAPAAFADQAALVWRNLDAQLRAGGMTLDNLVKVTIFLSDRKYSDENRAIRKSVLGARKVALTAIITGIFDSAWLLEIEAVAAR